MAQVKIPVTAIAVRVVRVEGHDLVRLVAVRFRGEEEGESQEFLVREGESFQISLEG